MCGISGIIQFEKYFSPEDLSNRSLEIANSMQYRGPDAGGSWISENGLLSFSHRRLAIIDLTDAGAQPMRSVDGRYVITFNGEIYNFLELRVQLEAAGVVFRSHSDTEVLLESYRHWGAQMLSRLDGMFAFAIYDQVKEEVFLARDPFGEKPLYYTNSSRIFAFSSELKPLLNLPEVSDAISSEAIAEYLCLQYIGEDRSLYQDIKKLPPAHWVLVNLSGKVQIEQYFKYEPEGDVLRRASLDELAEELESLLITSLRRRLISDVPLGAFLSGGVDSSLTVALAKKKLNRDVHTFSIGFTETRESEHLYAREFAKHLGTTHKDEMIEPFNVSFAIELGKMLDEPNADTSCLPVYALSRLAKRSVTVALSGDGGDELFGGYGRYLGLGVESKKAQLKLRGGIHQFEAMRYYPQKIQVFSDSEVHRLFGGIAPRLKERMYGLRSDIILPNKHLISRLRQSDFNHYMPGAVLAKVDRMSMLNSLETRTPFYNLDVIRFAQQMPIEHLTSKNQGKLVLKRIGSKYLPSEWLTRPKMGFGLPYTGWAHQAAVDTFRELCISKDSVVCNWINRKELENFHHEQKVQQNFSLYKTWAMIVLESYLRSNRNSVDTAKEVVKVREVDFGVEAHDYRFICELKNHSISQAKLYCITQGEPPSFISKLAGDIKIVSTHSLVGQNNPVEIVNWVDDWASVWNKLNQEIKGKSAILIFPHGMPRRLTPFNVSKNVSVFHRQKNGWFKFTSSKSMWKWKILNLLNNLYFKVIQHNLVLRKSSFQGLANEWIEAKLPQSFSRNKYQLLEDVDPITEYSNEEVGIIKFRSNDLADPVRNKRKYRILKLFHPAARVSRRLARFYYGDPIISHHPSAELAEKLIGQVIQKRNEGKITNNSKCNSPKKILILASSLGHGGAERQLLNLANSLAKEGYKIHVLTMHPLRDKISNDYLHLIEDSENLIVEDLESVSNSPVNSHFSDDTETQELIENLLGSLDLDIAHVFFPVISYIQKHRPSSIISFLDTPNIIAMLAGLVCGTDKILVSFRNYSPRHFFFNTKWFLPYYRVLIRMDSVRISTNSIRGLEDYLEWLNYQHPKSFYTPNGIDSNTFKVFDANKRATLRDDWGKGRPIVLGAFRLSPEKDPELFLQTAKQVLKNRPDVLFIIAGTGQENSGFQAMIEALGLQKNFHLLGRENRMQEIYNVADLILLTSKYEGTPNVLIEAQLCGLPAVTTDVGDAKNCVVHGITGLVAKERESYELAKLCLQIIEKKEHFHEQTKNIGRAHIEKHYSFKNMAQSFLKALE